MAEYALTTLDNPYNPFEEFTQWFLFDQEKGYCSTSYLGRICYTSDQLSDKENEQQIEDAINEIIMNDVTQMYRKVTQEDYKNGKFKEMYDEYAREHKDEKE